MNTVYSKNTTAHTIFTITNYNHTYREGQAIYTYKRHRMTQADLERITPIPEPVPKRARVEQPDTGTIHLNVSIICSEYCVCYVAHFTYTTVYTQALYSNCSTLHLERIGGGNFSLSA